MIKFEIDSSGEGLEAFFDSNGIDELIGYLKFIKKENESMHLLVGNELSEEKINNGNNTNVKHIKIVYISEEDM